MADWFTALLVFLGFVVLKLVVNGAKWWQAERYVDFYLNWLEDDSWELDRQASQIVRLLKNASVSDSYVQFVQPLGFMQLATGSASVMANLSNRREDVVRSVLRMLHRAVGVYRARTLEALNPVYWVELVLNLPREVLGYLGVPPESVVLRAVQLVYWALGLVASTLYAVFGSEVETWVRGLFS